eukprot:scaffold121136_cov19-Prasinocladus_malaysianus.AAC.3
MTHLSSRCWMTWLGYPQAEPTTICDDNRSIRPTSSPAASTRKRLAVLTPSLIKLESFQSITCTTTVNKNKQYNDDRAAQQVCRMAAYHHVCSVRALYTSVIKRCRHSFLGYFLRAIPLIHRMNKFDTSIDKHRLTIGRYCLAVLIRPDTWLNEVMEPYALSEGAHWPQKTMC